MKKISLILMVVVSVITMVSPVYAEDFAVTLTQEGAFTSEAWKSSGPSAESFVATLAKEQETYRKTGGIITTGLGLVLLGVGASYSDEDPEFEEDGKTFFYITGGVVTALGVCTLVIPSYVETEYERVLEIEDPYKREQASYAALVNVANQARISRLSTGVLSGALCLYSLNSDPPAHYSDDYNTYNALLYGAMCAYSFLVESTPERMLNEYQEGQRASQNNSTFAVVPKLDGTITAVYTYNF